MADKTLARKSRPKRDQIMESVGGVTTREQSPSGPNETQIREFTWDIISIHTHMGKIQAIWAKALGVTGPQWLILVAVRDLDEGKGVSVRDVAAKLHVDPSFITTQSKCLERAGFMRRVASKEDARVVLMSLTDKAYKKIAELYSHQAIASHQTFSGLSEREMDDLNRRLARIKSCLAKVAHTIAMDE